MNNLYTNIPTQVVTRMIRHCSECSAPTIVFPDGSSLAESDWVDLEAKFQAS